MKKSKNIQRYAHIGEDFEGLWHIVYETVSGNDTSISYDYKEHFIEGNRTVKNEMLIVFKLKDIDFYPLNYMDEASKKCVEHNKPLRIQKEKIQTALEIIDKIKRGLEITIKKNDDNELCKEAIKSIDGFKLKLNTETNITNKEILTKEFCKDLNRYANNFMFAIADEKNKFMSLMTELNDELQKEVL